MSCCASSVRAYIARARSAPNRSRASLWKAAMPAIRKPPLRPLAPPATVPASSSTVSMPCCASRRAQESPPTPPPITHASTSTSPSSGGRGSYGASSQNGVVPLVMPRLR